MPAPTPRPIGQRVSKWGEGPLWWRGRLLYVDIEGHAIVRLDPASGAEETWNLGERVGSVVPCERGGCLYAGDSGIAAFDPATGKKSPLADPEAAKRPHNRFNDGKCDPAGRFWAGTISLAKKTGDAALYRLDPDGRLHRMLADLTNSNGIGWSPDARTMYHIDTPTRRVRAFDFDLRTGRIDGPRVLVDTARAGCEGSPDGMAVDSDGRLWIAFCHGGHVTCFDPDSGAPLLRIDLPAVETTACAFGGPRLERLFVTTGLKAGRHEPDAGRVFVVDGLEVRGLPAHAYAAG